MKVKVYSTTTCPYCDMVKDFLKKNKVNFENINVTKDRKKAKEMIDKSSQMGVPVIIVEKDDGSEEIIIGFDEHKLREALDL